MNNGRAILLRAAERIEIGESTSCCVAINDAVREIDVYCHISYLEALEHFESLFSPRIKRGAATFWDEDPSPDRQRQRADCLLLAAYSYEEARR